MTFRPVVRNPLLSAPKGSNTAVFQRPDSVGASSPMTCNLWETVSSGAINLSGWYVTRIKRTPGVRYTLNECFGPVASATGAAYWLCALYQFVLEDGWTRLRRVRSSGEFYVGIGDSPNSRIPDSFISSGSELVLEPEKHYVFAVWVGGAAVGVTAAQVIEDTSGGATLWGRAYSSSESSDQPVFRIASSDPSSHPLLSSSRDIALWAAFGTNEDSSYMF